MRKYFNMKFHYISILILSLSLVILITFQNCGRFDLNSNLLINKVDFSSQSSIAPQFLFSQGFQLPTSKQGVSEHDFFISVSQDVKLARNTKMHQWGVKYKQYNVWWSKLETQRSSAVPMNCPVGTVLIPDNEASRVALGYKKFHCYSKTELDNYDFIFNLNYRNGVQSGVVLWSSPTVYQHSQCLGFNFGGVYLKDGCVPRDDAMDDFEDYVNLLSSRYNGGSGGKISHFIIWNENSSPDWFDYTPNVSKSDRSEAAIEKRINKYVEMLKRSHSAIQRHQHDSLMYVSTDQLWGAWIHDGNFGVKRLLDGIWEKLGTEYSWSVAVHPYGNVQDSPGNSIYTFNNLEMVAEYQVTQLMKRGVTQPLSYPQSLLIASEQGWGFRPSDPQSRAKQAQQLCLAHQKVTSMNQVVAVAHNYFHSVEPGENQSGGSSIQGEFFGLIPYGIPADLTGVESTLTGRAYISTFNEELWGKSNNHFCCEQHRVGCSREKGIPTATPTAVPTTTPTQTPPPTLPPSVANKNHVMGIIDFVQAEGQQVKIQGWACMEEISRSIKIHMYTGESLSQMSIVGEFVANSNSENEIQSKCKTSGSSHRFIISLDQIQSQQLRGKKVYIFGISEVGKSNNILSRSGELSIPIISIVTPTPRPIITPTPTPNITPSPRVVTPTPIIVNYERANIHRFRKGKDYLYTTQQSEGINAGFLYEGLAFIMIANQVSGKTQAIYRCYLPDNHFFSSDSRCEGASVDGLIGHVLIQQEPGSKPLYRFYKSSMGQHLITTNKDEGLINGFNLEGIIGYVF